MKCPKCNFENPVGSTYCAACGGVLEEVIEILDDEMPSTPVYNSAPVQPVYTAPVQPVYTAPVQQTYSAPVQPTYNNVSNYASSMGMADYFSLIIGILLKPMSTFKNNGENLKIFKNSVILASIFGALMTLLFMVIEIINAVRVVEYSFFGPSETTWVFENIKNVDYLNIIYYFIGMMIIFFALSAVFYIGGLIAKKSVSFPKMLSIVTLSFSPVLIATVLTSMLFFLPGTVTLGILAVSCTYFVILLIHFINEEVKFQSVNGTIYYTLACYGFISVATTIFVSLMLEKIMTDVLSSLQY